jgi:hypothetical protein
MFLLIFIILVVLTIFLALYFIVNIRRFRSRFLNEANEGMQRTAKQPAKSLTENDIRQLPPPVQKYLQYTGVVGKEKVWNFRVFFTGQLQDVGKPAFKVNITQFSFMDIPTRLFLITGRMKGFQVTAIHIYKDTHATFQVKLLSTFSIVDQKEGNLNIAETVTMLNDMCLLAPSTLIDKRIKWEEIDDLHSKATYTNKGITVSAILEFNENGQLTSFYSDDRFYLSPKGEMIKTRWTTPVYNYREFGGVRIASEGKAIWSFPDRDFTYASFRIADLVYNLK